MNYFDLRESVEKWSSEEKFVPYYDPIAKKGRRYFPDFVIKYRNNRGELITEMIEVKPFREVVGPPENPKRKTQAWMKSVQTYCTNQAKWKAARRYCEERGWKFRIITEKDLPSL